MKWVAVILASRQYPQGGATTRQHQPTEFPSPLMETFAKLIGTAIMCHDSQSLKLDFPIDSRLRGNDGGFCKGLLDGRGIKGEGEIRQSHQRVIPSKARNLKSPTHISLGPSFPRRRETTRRQGVRATTRQNQPPPVTWAANYGRPCDRLYPNHPDQPLIPARESGNQP